MKYQANPVIVEALVITKAGKMGFRGTVDLVLEDGTEFEADAGMCARYIPQAGDYWVKQDDGYIYINPKGVFEWKYSPIPLSPDSVLNCQIPEGYTPNCSPDNAIEYRGWRIWRWTGWKGHKGIHRHTNGICPGDRREWCLCTACGKLLGNNSYVYETQAEVEVKHWECSGDPGTVFGQWVAFKGKDTKEKDPNRIYAYASVPGSQGSHTPGGLFDISLQPGQRVLTYDTPQKELLEAREECLERLKRTIDELEAQMQMKSNT